MVDEVFKRDLTPDKAVYPTQGYRGIVRKMMGDGRLCIPAEFWKALGLKKFDNVEMLLSVQNELIIFAAGTSMRDYIGVQRAITRQGQICIPAEYRRLISFETDSDVEIFLTAQKEIIIRPYKTYGQ